VDANKRLPRAVLVLSAVSLLNDAASEVIVPLLPAFLATIGAGPAALGVLEGLSEATASFVKLAVGRRADRVSHRKAPTLLGYALANAVRPLIGLATAWPQILWLRLVDRVGKGIRSPIRDAWIADATAPEQLGRAFGFHRAADHAGAVIGPLLAYTLLACGLTTRHVFFASAVPGAAAVLVLLFLGREGQTHSARARSSNPAPQPGARRLLAAIGLFALGNSSDAFLLWRAQELGVAIRYAPLLWVVLHVSKSATSTWGGALSDRVGRRSVIRAGWLLHAAVYVGFGLARAPWQVWLLFGLYGPVFGLTEAAEKAYIVELATFARRGTALGLYHAVVGGGLLLASLFFGLVYRFYGPVVAFSSGAGLAFAAMTLIPAPRAASTPLFVA
jgi:MFS family permease